LGNIRNTPSGILQKDFAGLAWLAQLFMQRAAAKTNA